MAVFTTGKYFAPPQIVKTRFLLRFFEKLKRQVIKLSGFSGQLTMPLRLQH